MMLFLLIVLLILEPSEYRTLQILADFSVIAQKHCVIITQSNSSHINLYQSLICGTPLYEEPAKSIFINTQLYHLVVVSGTHLILINRVLSLIPMGRFSFILKKVFLFMYCIFTGWQAPAVRSFLNILIHHINSNSKLNWSTFWTFFYCQCICIILFNHWTISLSFILSNVAALSFAICIQFKKNNIFYISLTSYLLMLPVLCYICPPSPLGIVYNITLGPLISIFLIPLSLLCLIPWLSPFCDQLVNYFLNLTLSISPELLNFKTYNIQFKIIWSYLITIEFIIALILIQKRSKLAVN